MKIYCSRQQSTLDILKKFCQTDIWIPVKFSNALNLYRQIYYINVRQILHDKIVKYFCIAGSCVYESGEGWNEYNDTAKNMITQYMNGSWYPDTSNVDDIEILDLSRVYSTAELLEMAEGQ